MLTPRLPRSRGPAHFPSRLSALSLAATLCASVGLGTATPAQAQAAAARSASAQALRPYTIVAGPLETALNQFARQAGVLISFDPALVRGLSSPGLSGHATVQAGLDALLGDHPLAAQAEASDAWRIRAARPSTPGAGAAGDKVRPVEKTLPGVTVTGQRDPRQNVFETAGSVAVVTREEIDRLPPRNSADVLADVPGVYTSQSRMDPGLSVNIRGLQDFGRVNVMIDGTRQNYQQSGHGSNGSVYLDPELLGGVDIAKGPTSTVGGAGMIAGMVNFRTLEVDDLVREGDTRGARINTTTGSNAYNFAGSAALGLKARDDLDLVMVASRKKIGEFTKGRRGSVTEGLDSVVHGVSQLTSQDQASALLKATWRFAPEQALKLSYIGLDAKFGESPQSASAGGIQNHVRSDTLLANHRWSPSATPWLDLKSSLYYTRTRNQAHRFAGGTLDDNEYQLRYQTSTVGGTLENTSRLALGAADNLILKTGGEFFHDWTSPKAQSLSIGADAGTTALYTGATPEGQRTVASLFGEANLLHSDWLEITGGLRYDWYGLVGDGRMRIGSIANPPGVRPASTVLYTRFKADRHDGAFSPKLSVAVKPTEQLQFFTSIGKGMRPPALTEALLWGQHTGSLFPYYPNPDLSAERSRNWELGVNGLFDDVALRGDKLRVKAAWFNSQVTNYVTLARIMSPIDTAGGGLLGPYAYVNLDDPFRSKGLEMQADYDTGRVFAGVNYTHMLVDSGRGGYNPFPLGSLRGYPANTLGAPGDANIWYVLPPRKNLSVSGGVRLLDKKLTVGGRVRYQAPSVNSSVWTTQGDRYNQKAWQLYDLWASYEVNPHVTLRLAINNLRDLNYSEMQGGSYFVGPGRTATATLSVRF